MLEFEKKVLLTQSEYEVLKRLVPQGTKSQLQVNYYYDTDDFKMNRQGITCRIRGKDGKWNATIKTHRFRKGRCSHEKTRRVSGKYDDSFFKGMHVKMQGCLTTLRTILYADKSLEIVLDENRYLDFRDYELEIEYGAYNAAYAEYVLFRLSEFLQAQNGLTDAESFRMRAQTAKSKSERFFEKARLFR